MSNVLSAFLMGCTKVNFSDPEDYTMQDDYPGNELDSNEVSLFDSLGLTELNLVDSKPKRRLSSTPSGSWTRIILNLKQIQVPLGALDPLKTPMACAAVDVFDVQPRRSFRPSQKLFRFT
jgi:hypothetical protein